MNVEVTVVSFLGWIVAGAGFRVGWGIIGILIDLLSSAVGRTGKIPRE
jgi:hypothetical protein